MPFFEGANRGFDRGVGLGASMYEQEMARQAREAEKAQAQSNFERELALKSRGGAGMKLKPGERYNPQTDTVEIVPGSSLYQEQAGKHKKDLSALTGVKQKSEMANEKINDIFSKPENIASQFGGYNALVGQYLNPDAKIKIESLKSNLKSAGLELIKNGGGIGAISEAEWPIMEGLIGKLDPRMSEEEATHTLKEIQTRFKSMQDRTNEAYQLQWGNTPFVNPMRTGPAGFTPSQPPSGQVGASAGGPKAGDIEGGYRFKGGNPADPNAWELAQ